MTLDESWVTEMARLFAQRDHARSMLERWQRKVEEAEAAIIALKVNQEPVTVIENTEPEQVPVA
jgi:uncharacterized protein YfcZ (UPF0381/DUF406 family)